VGSNAAPRHQLKDHPNFELPAPRRGETSICYALRCAALLISPPKLEGENYTIACAEVARQIEALEAEVERLWQRRK